MRLFERFDRLVERAQLSVLNSIGVDLISSKPVINTKETPTNVQCPSCNQPRKIRSTCDSCGAPPSKEEFK